jgi:hypothetical protein
VEDMVVDVVVEARLEREERCREGCFRVGCVGCGGGCC